MRLEGGYVKGPFFILTNLVGPERVDANPRLEEGGLESFRWEWEEGAVAEGLYTSGELHNEGVRPRWETRTVGGVDKEESTW